MKLNKFLEAMGFSFEPIRPIVKEKPYQFTPDTDPLYTDSWKKTANARKQESFISIDKYFNSKKAEGMAFKKKAYKNMKKK